MSQHEKNWNNKTKRGIDKQSKGYDKDHQKLANRSDNKRRSVG